MISRYILQLEQTEFLFKLRFNKFATYFEMSQWTDMICQQDLIQIVESKSIYKPHDEYYHRKSAVSLIAPTGNKYINQQDYYLLEVTFTDAGLNVLLIIYDIKQDQCQQFNKFFGNINQFPKAIRSSYGELRQVYQQFFGQKRYRIQKNGQIIHEYQTIVTYRYSILDEVLMQSQIIKLSAKPLSSRQKQNYISKYFRRQKQSRSPILLKQQKNKKWAQFLQLTNKKQTGTKQNQRQSTSQQLSIRFYGEHENMINTQQSIWNQTTEFCVISPKISIKQQQLEMMILNNPEGLTVGVMFQNDLVNKKIITSNQQLLPSQFVAFSSRQIRNQKKTYAYKLYSFHKYSIVKIKLEKNKILLGVDDQKMQHFSRKSMIPFIQLALGCQIQFMNRILKKEE